MKLQKPHAILLSAIALAGCSLGPRLETSMPQIRNVPVLANLSPSDSLSRGRTFLATKQYGLAIELFKAASRDDSLAAESLNGLAIAYDGIGRKDLAERYFQRALAARPGDARTKRNLAAFYSTSGQVEKRRELLAEVTPAPIFPVALLADESLPQFAATSAAAAAPSVSLASRSPLGSAFRPLLVEAALAGGPTHSMALSGVRETMIFCAPDDQRDRPAPSIGAMEMFRLSIGEIFIMARPVGSNCSIHADMDPTAATAAETSISNREYLGLVADYLDRLNKGAMPVADISTLWRATFMPLEDKA